MRQMITSLKDIRGVSRITRRTYPHVVAEEVSHDALDDVEADVGPSAGELRGERYLLGVAHVGVIVHGRAAHIPGDEVLVCVPRHKHLLNSMGVIARASTLPSVGRTSS